MVALLPVKTILPDVLKLIDLVLAVADEKVVLVKTLLFKFIAPAVNVNAPPNVNDAPRVNVTVEVLKVTDVATAPTAVVQVPVPELESKVTVSAATGAEAPDAPPEVEAQFAVLLASHVPVPPTQNLFAIIVSCYG
jgi:hypothetical protein